MKKPLSFICLSLTLFCQLLPLSSEILVAANTPPPKSGNELEATDVGSTDLKRNQDLASKDERMKWWHEARFGCFVHWGPSTVLANEWRGQKGGGYAEHIQRVLKISMADYKKEVVEKFNPVKFNADEWIALAKNTGMKYFIVTAKHHDGFAMYDSKVSDYNIVKATPWKHDPMKDLKAACDREGIAFGFYYSHAFDWGDEFAPGNDWEWKNPGGDLFLGGREWWLNDPVKLQSVREKYVDVKAIPQIQELVKIYRPKILWFDTPSKLPVSENTRILEAVRKTDPYLVVNSRLVRDKGDYLSTGDRSVEFQNLKTDWEAIPTTNDSYGWNPLDNDYKTPGFLIQVLEKAVSRGGNLLLNIGPTKDGTVDPHDVAILNGIGKWMSIYGDTIHGCNASPLPPQSWGVITSKSTTLYLHIFDWTPKSLVVGGLHSTPKKAYLLKPGGREVVGFKRINDHDLEINLPSKAIDSISSIVQLEFDKIPQGGGTRLISNRTKTNQLLAFDAERHRGDLKGSESGLGYRDGKLKNYCIDNWNSTDQWISWEVRLNQPTEFDLSLNYGIGLGGEYEVRSGSWKVTKTAPSSGIKDAWIADTKIEPLGSLSLPAGVHQIELRVTKVNDKDAFRPLELFLTPRKK